MAEENVSSAQGHGAQVDLCQRQPVDRPSRKAVGDIDDYPAPCEAGLTDVGETSFAWRRVIIDVADGFATWSIDGLPLAKVDLSTVTLGGGNIFFGHSDTNASSSTDANDVLLNVTLIDNIEVIPEPATAALLSAGSLLILRRRRV